VSLASVLNAPRKLGQVQSYTRYWGSPVQQPGQVQAQSVGPVQQVGVSTKNQFAPQISGVSNIGWNAVNAPTYGHVRNVNTPTFMPVQQVGFDPYAAAGITGIDRVQGQHLDPNAHMIGDTPNVGWQGVQAYGADQGAIQAELRRQAQQDLALGGRLSDQDMRDSDQATRQSFADRGMGRANAAVFTEALNRDRFSRERQNERREFAAGVDQQDFAQRAFNAQQMQQAGIVDAQGRLQADSATAGMAMQGLLGNQQIGAQLGMANQATGLQAAMANQQARLTQDQFNAGARNQASQFNRQSALQAAMANQGADLSRATTMYQGGLQASMANQQADVTREQTRFQGGLQASMANQNAAMQAAMANQNAGLQTRLANQQSVLANQLSMRDSQLRAGIANQSAGLQAGMANQSAGLTAAMANQSTGLSKYGIDRGINQQNTMWHMNHNANQQINAQNMAAIQAMMQMYR